MGIETMLANRVAMGPSVEPPRFRWVPYADALIFPLDNSRLAAQNPDRQAFFPLEDKLRARYLAECGLSALPATLAEYLAQVVTPTLERHKKGGAVAEKFEAAYLRSLAFDAADAAQADHVYRQRAPNNADYKVLQSFARMDRPGCLSYLNSADLFLGTVSDFHCPARKCLASMTICPMW
jgi:hypothetical protein